MPTLLHYPPGIGFSAAVGSLMFAAILALEVLPYAYSLGSQLFAGTALA